MILIVVVYSFPVDELKTSDREIDNDAAHEKGTEEMKYDPEDEDLYMFKLKELVECYKKQGLDPGNLPNIKDISEEDQKDIFDSCNHFFNLPVIAIVNSGHHSRHQDDELNHRQEKRSSTRTNHRTSKTTRMTKTTMDETNQPPTIILTPNINPSQPINVRVTFAGLNLIREVLRLQFLFLNTFFSSLSACISTEDVEISMCLLDSFSTAFSVLSIELSENK